MRRLLAPISAHEGLARGALVVALVVGGALAATTDVDPPDYAIDLPYLRDEVIELTGVEPTGSHGGTRDGSPGMYGTWLSTGDEVRVQAWWSDRPVVAPPDEFTVQAERRHECIRLVLSTTGPDLPADRIAAYLDAHVAALDAELGQLPRDPCAGRPRTP